MNPSPLLSGSPAIVYIDFKSPYAYLAIEPTRALERELGLQFDWRPFVLDIPSYLGSARLGKDGEVVEQQRSIDQWAGVKYAYYDCRRYARLQGFNIRGTEKIWDTNLVSTAMLWTRQFGHAVTQRFIDCVYPPFWARELDVESPTVIAQLLSELALNGDDFLAWMNTEGLQLNAALQSSAFAAGIYGVPTYVVAGECFFGREHLPSVRWLLQGCVTERPDIENPLPSQTGAAEQQVPTAEQAIVIGVDDSLDSLLALPKLFSLLKDYPGSVQWLRTTQRPILVAPPADDVSRAAMHTRLRMANRQADIARYGPADVSSDDHDYGERIATLLHANNITLSEEGPAQVVHPAMAGIVILLGEELFIGRQHLALIARCIHHR